MIYFKRNLSGVWTQICLAYGNWAEGIEEYAAVAEQKIAAKMERIVVELKQERQQLVNKHTAVEKYFEACQNGAEKVWFLILLKIFGYIVFIRPVKM